MAKTKIEWTDVSWNPVRGCSLVSAGCKNCYAMKQAHRMSGPGGAYEGLTEIGPTGPRWNGKIQLVPDALEQPLSWKKPRRVFVNSMSDLFHPDVPFQFIDKVFAVMALCPHHTFQILTKRPERMRKYFSKAIGRDGTVCDAAGDSGLNIEREMKIRDATARYLNFTADKVSPIYFPLPNVWLGVSVEDQKTADERIPILLKTPAAVRFVSYEPALGPVDFEIYMMGFEDGPDGGEMVRLKKPPIDWVIMGAESGPKARPMHPDWARSVRDQCQEAGVAFFFKQWGEWKPIGPLYCEDDTSEHVLALAFDPEHKSVNWVMEDGLIWPFCEGQPPGNPWVMYRTGKKEAGRLLDSKEHNEFPLAGPSIALTLPYKDS